MSSSADSDSNTPPPQVGQRRFTSAQRAVLNSYYKAGMTGESKKHLPLIERCSADIGSSVIKVKVSFTTVSSFIIPTQV